MFSDFRQGGRCLGRTREIGKRRSGDDVICTGDLLKSHPTVELARRIVLTNGQFDDRQETALYDEMLRETDLTKQRALMREFEKYVLDTQSHEIFLLWWYRTVPYRSYVKGWKISPSHYLNQDLATVWLDK